MRRLYLGVTFLFVSAWLVWSACERDDYRSELPLRPLDGGSVGTSADMPVDLAKPPQPGDLMPVQDLPAKTDMGGSSDGGAASDGGTVSDGSLPDQAMQG